MTISQLISLLERLRTLHGDIDVRVFDQDRVRPPEVRVMECNGVDDLWRQQVILR